MSGVTSTIINSWLFPGCIALFLSSGRAGGTVDANEDGSDYKFSIITIEIAPDCVDIHGLFQTGPFPLGIAPIPVAICILLLALAVLAGIGTAAIRAGGTPCITTTKCNMRGIQTYRQGSYPQALDVSAWQLHLVEHQEQGGADSKWALNNLALTSFKTGRPERACAWMSLVLDRGYSGKAAYHNLEQAALKVDYPSLQGLARHYLRYAGQAKQESLQIEPAKGGYRASFALMCIGSPEKLMEHRPAVIGELSGRLGGQGVLYRLRSEGLGAGYSLLVWQEDIDL